MEQWLPVKHPGDYRERNVETGMRHGFVRWPHGNPPTPFGCRWCGIDKRSHPFGPTWLRGRGFHDWERPTQHQILARMKARRRARKEVVRSA